MKWLDCGNRVASALGIGVRLHPLATRLPRGGALDSYRTLNDNPGSGLESNNARAQQ